MQGDPHVFACLLPGRARAMTETPAYGEHWRAPARHTTRDAPELRGRYAPEGTSIAGGVKAVSGGGGSVSRPTSTRVVWAPRHWPSFEVPLSSVSTLGLPRLSRLPGVAGSAGSNHAPVASCTTPGRRAVVTTAPARQEPAHWRRTPRRHRECHAPRRPRGGATGLHGLRPWPGGSLCCNRAHCGVVRSADWRADAGGVRGLRAAQPFGRLQPRGMPRAVLIAKAVNGLGKNFNTARRGGQRASGSCRNAANKTGGCSGRGTSTVPASQNASKGGSVSCCWGPADAPRHTGGAATPSHCAPQ